MSATHHRVLDAFPVLQRDGFGLVDVGAREGVHPMFEEVAPLVRVIGFEPEEEAYHRLQTQPMQGRWRSVSYLPCALGERDTTRPLYVCRSPGASSFYQPNRAWLDRFPNPDRYDVIRTQWVPVRALDSLLRDPNSQLPTAIDFIKIDAQGAELAVLKGASQALSRHTIGVEVEVEFVRLYDGQPLFRDLDAFLSEQGFTLFKLRRKSWVRRTCQTRPQLSAGQLIAGDALYLRDPLRQSPQHAMEWSAHQLEALVLIASLYDLNDFSLELLAHATLSSAMAVEPLERLIRQRSRRLDFRAESGPVDFSLRMLKECVQGRRGMGNLYAWLMRGSWGRADSDRDFYTRV